jgi:hypothetical protein
VTVNGAAFHIRFKCGVEDRNQRVELISGQSSHRTSFRRVFDDGSILTHGVSLYFGSYENSIPLNLMMSNLPGLQAQRRPVHQLPYTAKDQTPDPYPALPGE